MQLLTSPMPLSSEVIDDRVATVLEAGTNITLNYDDTANVLTISAATSATGAPTDAEYVTSTVNGTLSAERVLTDTATVTWDRTTPGQMKANAAAGTSYTDEQAQDAVGSIIADSATIDFLYDDTTPSISGFVKDNSITEPMLNLSDNTTKNSSISTHGLLPKLPGDTVTFLRGDGTWVTPPTGTSYTNEEAQDAVGNILVDSPRIDFTYNDATPSITADIVAGSITETQIGLSDVTADNATTSQHGFLPKLSGSAANYLDGTGAWTTPAGGTSDWERTVLTYSTANTGLLAFWRMEETSGNRTDSVASIALVPTGIPGSAAGKTGTAVSFDTGSGKYLSAADSATLSIGTNQDFTIACWIYFNGTPLGARGIVGKGDVSAIYGGAEYLLGTAGTALRWYIGNGASVTTIDASGITLTSSTWYFVVAWYDATADLMYIQVNNGTPSSAANAHGSYNSAFAMEVGRQPNWSGSTPLDGRVDNLMFWKRVLTATERTELYNSGNGVDYPLTLGVISPVISTDVLMLETSTLTPSSIANGGIRWTGTDLEVRKGGAWVSLTAASDDVRTETFLHMGA